MRKINLLVVHCSATPPDMDIGAAEIRRWHVNDNKWADIGYHHVIRRDGTIERGRAEATTGAHASGHNAASIGICLVGGVRRNAGKLVAQENFTPAQWTALRSLLEELLQRYPGARVLGHRDVDNRKACPSFSVRDWMRCQAFAGDVAWT
jgi:N-acetyl-anhydromuramyl-L-alanine amidase AmpD